MPNTQAQSPREVKDLNQTPSFLIPLDLLAYNDQEKPIVPTEIAPNDKLNHKVLFGN